MPISPVRLSPIRRYLLRAEDPAGARRALRATANFLGADSEVDFRWEKLTVSDLQHVLKESAHLGLAAEDQAHLLEHIHGVIHQCLAAKAIRPETAARLLLVSSADLRPAISLRHRKQEPTVAKPKSMPAQKMVLKLEKPSVPSEIPLRGRDRTFLDPVLECLGSTNDEIPWDRMTAEALSSILRHLEDRGADRLQLSRILSTLDRLSVQAAEKNLITADEADRLRALTLAPDIITPERRCQAKKSALDALKRASVSQPVASKLPADAFDMTTGILTLPFGDNRSYEVRLKGDLRRRVQYWIEYWLSDKNGPMFPDV